MNEELKELLESLVERYNNISFIEDDPISIPHQFETEEDIEISGFLVSTIAWGNRKSIVKNGNRMVNMMGGEPFRFVMEADEIELAEMSNFVHRTFNGGDFIYFLKSIRNIYKNHNGIGGFFQEEYLKCGDMREVIKKFWNLFFELEHQRRVEKHLSSISKGAACKRLNMYLRWLVREDSHGVDFGLWKKIPSSALYLPLDVHSGNVGRELGLLQRTQNDWKSVEEVTKNLRLYDIEDPVKYDYALFGVGVNGYNF